MFDTIIKITFKFHIDIQIKSYKGKILKYKFLFVGQYIYIYASYNKFSMKLNLKIINKL